jgi:hypothetical protein
VKSVSTLWAVADLAVAAVIEQAHQAAVNDALATAQATNATVLIHVSTRRDLLMAACRTPRRVSTPRPQTVMPSRWNTRWNQLGPSSLRNALQEIPSAGVIGVLSSVLWLGSFVLAPVASWTGVRGTSGEIRRRAVVAGLASVVPVVIIALCITLGTAAETQGFSEDAAVTA